MIITLVLMMAVAIVSVYFALDNTEIVKVMFFNYPLQGTMGVVLLVAFGFGILLGVLLIMPTVIGRNIKLARTQRRVNELEQATFSNPDSPK